MQVPFHPIMVHFPLAMAFVIPVLVIVVAVMIKKNKLPVLAWTIIIGLQLATTVAGYIALETGETDEQLVKKVVDKKIIHEHEEAAEIFVGSTVIALVLSVAAFFLRQEIQFFGFLVVGLLTLMSGYLGFKTGESGGELVYVHGAARAHGDGELTEGILPTPGLNTSESPVEENESLKADDSDYGNSDEESDFEDEELKQED